MKRKELEFSKLECPEGFEELALPFNIGTRRLAFSDPVTHPQGLSLKLFGNINDKSVCGFARCGSMMEGPPGFVHGGILAYILDEAMGSAAWNLGKPVVAEQIEVRYLKMVPQNQVIKIEARLIKIEGPLVAIEGKLKDSNDRVLCSATGRFHILSAAQLQAIASHANIEIPESLKKFKDT